MIKAGCLDGIDEVYGFHNISLFTEGEVRVIPGPLMA
jgi:metal-dependent amidase/aminoacylase/carboxypeptidase family protein